MNRVVKLVARQAAYVPHMFGATKHRRCGATACRHVLSPDLEYLLMRIRCDGQQTRQRIIDLACNVFGDRGYRDATHEAICAKTEVNKAAINHHFGDKKSLYRAVWQHLLDAADRDHPVLGNLSEDATAAERLETHVRSLLNRHHGEGASWQLARLRDLEKVNPTGLIDDIRSAHHDSNQKQMLSALRELLGDKVCRSAMRFYETSVLALCRGGWSASALPGSDSPGRRLMGARKINMLAKQITRFLLAGIETKVHEEKSFHK